MEYEITTNSAGAVDFPALYPRYIAYIDASEKTVATYTRALRQFVNYIRENNITSPTRDDIILYRQQLSERLKATTVQNYMESVKLFFRWTAQEGLYPNIADHVKGAKLTKEHKKDYLSPRQIKQVLKGFNRTTTSGRRDYALFLLMVTGGLRDIEIHRANIEDLRTLGEQTVLYLQGKGRDDKSEFVKVMDEVEDAIRESLKDRPTAAGTDPLFISLSNNSRGQRMSTRSISGIIKDALIKAGYNSERLTAHSLRHTAVTISLLNGSSLQEVQKFARHSNITTTEIYSHNIDRMASKCEESIAKAIF